MRRGWLKQDGKESSEGGANDEEEFGVWIGATDHLQKLLIYSRTKDAVVVADA